MIFTEEEMIIILKKHLPKTDYKELENIAQSLLRESQQWQEVDLKEHIHNDVESKVLHDICQRGTSNKRPANIRLFFR